MFEAHRPSSCDSGFVLAGGFDTKGEAHEKVVVAFGRVDEEVESLAWSVEGLRFFHLGPESLALPGAVWTVDLEPAGVHGGEQAEAELRLGSGGKRKRGDDAAKGVPQEGIDGFADTRGVDNDPAAVPDVLENMDQLAIEIGVLLPGAGEVVDDLH